MIEILTQLHQYVPQYTYHEEREISNGTVEKIVKANMRQILLGGDQLTAARSRSSIKAKMNSQTPSKQLLGIIPVVEDWHTKANFLGVSLVLYGITHSVTIKYFFFLVDMEILLLIEFCFPIWNIVST